MSARTLSPASALQNARVRVRRAEEQCPHWDYESNGCGYACCDELDAAEREHRVAAARAEVSP